jgi:hypothetical protein
VEEKMKKPRQSKKETKSLKRTKVSAQPEEEIPTAIKSTLAEAPEATPAISETEVPLNLNRPRW